MKTGSVSKGTWVHRFAILSHCSHCGAVKKLHACRPQDDATTP